MNDMTPITLEVTPMSIAAVTPVYPQVTLTYEQQQANLAILNLVADAGVKGKIECIKQVRALTGLGLKEAKDLVEKMLTHQSTWNPPRVEYRERTVYEDKEEGQFLTLVRDPKKETWSEKGAPRYSRSSAIWDAGDVQVDHPNADVMLVRVIAKTDRTLKVLK